MPFRGFMIESKSYMSYDRRDTAGKIRFWLWYPIAWIRWTYMNLTNWKGPIS